MENDVFDIPLCSGNSLNPFIEINCTLTIEKLFQTTTSIDEPF